MSAKVAELQGPTSQWAVALASTMLLGKALQPIGQIVGSGKMLAYKRLNPMIQQVMQRAAPMALPAPTGQLTASAWVYRPPSSDRARRSRPASR